ncbi:hypothetical protein IAT40_002429 [Kwoniella sp. CBS 6097]
MLTKILPLVALMSLLTPALGADDDNTVQATVHVNFPLDTTYVDAVTGVSEVAPRPHDFNFTIGDIRKAKNGTQIDKAVASEPSEDGGENGGKNINRDGWVTKNFDWLVYDNSTVGANTSQLIYNSTCYVSIMPALKGEFNFELLRQSPFLTGDTDQWDDVVVECPDTQCMLSSCYYWPEPKWTGQPVV